MPTIPWVTQDGGHPISSFILPPSLLHLHSSKRLILNHHFPLLYRWSGGTPFLWLGGFLVAGACWVSGPRLESVLGHLSWDKWSSGTDHPGQIAI
jgi:hypothetical protein